MTKDKFEQLLNEYKEAIIDRCNVKEDLRNDMYEDKAKSMKYLKELSWKVEEIEEELLTVFDPTPIIW